MHSTRRHLALFAAALSLLMILSGLGFEFGGASAAAHHGEGISSISPQFASTLDATLATGSNPVVLNESFWGTTISARSPFFSNESALISAAGTPVALWPGAWAGDDYDPFNNQLYSSATNYHTAPTTEAQFVAYCKSVNCTAIMELPGEMNNATFAAQVVQYTEQNLSFTPALWEIGNEPGLWGHWSPTPATWADWTHYTGAPDAIQYASEEWNYTQAIDKVDPGFKFVGIPGVGPGGVLYNWINATIALNGPNISGMAVHVYPDVTGSNNSLGTFYHFLNISNYDSIPGREPNLENWIREAVEYSPSCRVARCGTMPVMYTEMGSAISGRPDGSHYSEGFAGALFMAAEFTQAFAANITTVEAYASVLDTVNSWYTVSGAPHPLFSLYTDMLSHLGPVIYPATLTVKGDAGVSGNLYATESVDPAAGGREDFMAVNLNQFNNVSFAPGLSGYTPGTSVEVWQWNSTNSSGFDIAPATPAPVPSFFPEGLPTNWTLPEQSVVLFEALPGGGAPARFTETGLPNDTRWFVGVGNRTGTSPTPTITLLLRPGAYATLPGPPVGIPGHLKTERFAPGAPIHFVLPATGTNVSVPYFLQYSLNLTVSPTYAGTIGPPTTWANANSTVQVTATPTPGFGFIAWYGQGNGSYNGSANPTTLTVREPIHETAIFGVGYAVTFVESGLPSGTPWSVTIRDDTLAGDEAALIATEPNGTYGFQVANVTGYTVQPVSSYVHVNGTDVVVLVAFKEIRVLYSVTFTESGLTSGTAWRVTIRNTTYYATIPTIRVDELNGTYGFQVTVPSGYRVVPVSSFFTVVDENLSIAVNFTQIHIDYPIVWDESGLPNGTAWSVTVRGNTTATSGTEIELWEINGTYSYSFGNVVGYRASPPEGGVTLAGSGLTLSVRWAPLPPAQYVVTFSIGALPAGANWSVSFAGQNATSTNTSIEFSVSNGTFHFGVTPPAGHYVTPGGGTVVVAGVPLTIALALETPAPPSAPPPSESTELARALAVLGVLALVGAVTFFAFTRRSRQETPAPAPVTAPPLAEYIEDSEPPIGSIVAPDYHEDALPR
ncbi:MAG: InlB B-repeat-containing protein [Thermoplasmata archaeon]